MFILDVSVGVSVRFYVGDWFPFTLLFFLLDIRSLCRLLCGRRVRVGGWRVGLAGAPQLHLICGSVSAQRPGRAATRTARSEASPSDRLAACRQGFPRCTRDTSTQTLKILGSWMYALAYVNCDSFSFPFLVGARVAGRSTMRPGGALASISSDVSLITVARELQIRSETVRGVVPRRGMYSMFTIEPEKI